MSSRRKTQKSSGKKNVPEPPYVGALLRLTYQLARERQLAAQAKRGFSDLNQALLSVLVYPPPDGVRPSDLAERTNMTKQAMNYLLGQLEQLGYVERRANNGRRRSVYLTKKGWTVFETQWMAMRDLEEEWAKRVGQKRFAEFLDVLRELSGIKRQGAKPGL